MSPKRVLAMDVGDKRIGLALASYLARIAEPYKTIAVGPAVVDEIVTITKEQNVGRIVVGLPRNMNGEETEQTQKVKRFVSELSKKLSIPLDFQDESLTSVKAEAILAETANTQQL